MKVCFLAGTLGRGGAERQLIHMLRAVQAEGHHPTLLCLTTGEPLEKEIRDLGIDVRWVGASPNRLVRLVKVITAVRKLRAEIVQSSHYYTNIYAAIAGRVVGIRSIGAIRNNLTSEMAADRIFGRWQTELPDHLVVNSEAACTKALAIGVNPRRIDVVRNVVQQPNGNEALAAQKPRVRVLFAGRLVAQKRPGQFLKLATRLKRELAGTDLRFQIVGDGPLRTTLQETASHLGLSSRELVFAGELSDMSSVYRSSDLLVLTSEHEGTPNVVLEAMAHGLPVLATRVGGVPEILAEDRGILVDADDFEGLVDGAKKLVLDADLRRKLGSHAREFVSAHHSYGYLRARLVEIYEKVLTEGWRR